jgi:hypothetical protein
LIVDNEEQLRPIESCRGAYGLSAKETSRSYIQKELLFLTNQPPQYQPQGRFLAAKSKSTITKQNAFFGNPTNEFVCNGCSKNDFNCFHHGRGGITKA